jgi:hypothetical protein
MKFKEEISIWFFIGISLLVNGLLISGAGFYEWFVKPPAVPVVLYKFHANALWGAVLFIFGVIYCWNFRPGKHAVNTEAEAAERFEETHAS